MATTPTLDAITRRALIEQLRNYPQKLSDLVAGLTPQQLTTHFLPHEWTVAQNVHHVADSHMNSYIRLRLVLNEDYPTLRPYAQDDWAKAPEAQAADLSYSLELLRGLHVRWAEAFTALYDDQWTRLGYHPENGDVSVETMLRDYVAHGEAHIDQIRRTLAAQ